jgi:hypothetical protein
MLRCSVGNAAYFGSYSWCKENGAGSTLGGGVAGVAFWAVAMPFDVVKTRQQGQSYPTQPMSPATWCAAPFDHTEDAADARWRLLTLDSHHDRPRAKGTCAGVWRDPCHCGSRGERSLVNVIHGIVHCVIVCSERALCGERAAGHCAGRAWIMDWFHTNRYTYLCTYTHNHSYQLVPTLCASLLEGIVGAALLTDWWSAEHSATGCPGECDDVCNGRGDQRTSQAIVAK